VLHNAADGLSSALAEGAKANATIRAWVSGGGQAGWQLQLAAVTATMGMQAVQLMKSPELRAQCAETTRAQLKQAMGIVDEPEAGTNESGNV
jgi:Fe-S cluster assembly iron-binding protein IscA